MSRSDWSFSLTERQIDIARLVAEGLSNEEIGVKLHMSPQTVKHHLKNAFLQSGAKNRAHFAVRCVRQGIVE